MVLNTKRHTRLQFDDDLERVINLIKKMSEVVETQLKKSIDLFRIEDKSQVSVLAEQIIADDSQVNAFEVEINDACLYLIAKHQPKANDLRLVFALLRAAAEFERIGDTVTKICDTARNCEHVINSLIEQIEHFAEHALHLLHKSVKGFVHMDLKYATEIYCKEDYRTEYRHIYKQIIEEAKQDPDHLSEYFRANITLRQIERVGDRCRNINEFVYYYVQGITPRSQDLLDMYKELHPEEQ